MSDAEPEHPWIMQNVLLDAKVDRFRVALEKIAARKPDRDELGSDEVLATLKEVTDIAQVALDR